MPVADPHRNCFYYYRGPSAQQEEWARHRQVEDNTTKALVNLLEYSQPALVTSFVARFAGLDANSDDHPHYFLQDAPNPVDIQARRLLAISRLEEPPRVRDDEVEPGGGSRPDAAIHFPSEALVVLEVKLDLSLDYWQLKRHADAHGVAFPSDLRTVSWIQVYEWADGERRVQHEPVTEFLLEQFVRYLELVNLSPFSGMLPSDFDFFVTPTGDGQVEVKGRLESLWQAVAEGLPDAERTALGEFHVGALGLTDPNAWAMTNRGEEKVNLTLEMTGQELWFNIVGWQVPRARDLIEWLKSQGPRGELQRLPDYELVAFRRRCGNWAKRAPDKRAWWQRETFQEERRYPAPVVADRLDEFFVWIHSLDDPWEKPGFHLRKTWTREEAVALGRGLVPAVATEVSRTVPLVTAINAP